MALSIRGQALSLLLALAVGVGLGLLYDLLRPVRRRGGDTLWDLLFCFCAAVLAFGLAMRSESGALGTGELMLSLLGLLGYFRVLSPVCLPIILKWAGKIGVFCVKTQITIKKLPFMQKNSFKLDEYDL